MFDLNVMTAAPATSLTFTAAAGSAPAVGAVDTLDAEAEVAGAAEEVSAEASGAGAPDVETAGAGADRGAAGTAGRRCCARYQPPPAAATRRIAARKTFRAEPPSSRALLCAAEAPSVRRRTSARRPAAGRTGDGPRGVSRTRDDVGGAEPPGGMEAENWNPEDGVATVVSMSVSGIGNAGPSGTIWRRDRHSVRSSAQDAKRFARSFSRALRIIASRPRGSAGSSELGGAGLSFMIL